MVIPVPAKLQKSLKYKQIWRSLHTRSYGDAVINLNKEVAKIMNYLELLKKHDDVIMLEARHYERISDKCKAEALRQDQERRIRHFDNDDSLHLYEWQKQRDLDSLSIYKSCLSTGNYKKVTNLVEHSLAESGIFWQRRDMVFKQLCMEVLKKLIQAYQMIIERHEGQWQDMPNHVIETPSVYEFDTPAPRQRALPKPSPKKAIEEVEASSPMLMLADLIKAYNDSPEITQKSKAVKVKYRTFQTILLRCIGEETDIANINRNLYIEIC